MDRAIERDPCGALPIAASLMRHWILAEHFQEAGSVSAAALAAAAGRRCAARAVVHCGAGLVGMLGEDYAGAVREHPGRPGAARRPRGRRRTVGLPAALLDGVDPDRLDLEEGLRNAERAVELQRSIEDPLGLAFALVNLAVAAMLCERFAQVATAYEEFLAIPRAREHARLRTWAEQAAAWAQSRRAPPGARSSTPSWASRWRASGRR